MPCDWRFIATIDCAAVAARADIDALERACEHVVRCDVDAITDDDAIASRRGKTLMKTLQLLSEYLLHVQEALNAQKLKAESDAAAWRDRARRERDECRLARREVRVMKETHEEELVAIAAQYAKKRNAPDEAELEDARRRGERLASERFAKDLERRLREQRELFDGAIDRMRVAHAEARAESAREAASRKAELAAARAEYVSQTAEATKEANRMVYDAQTVVRDAREKAELEKSNAVRVKAELAEARDEARSAKRAATEAKTLTHKMSEDLKRERDAAAELRKALERRDDERRALHEKLETLNSKASRDKNEESQELVSLRELTKSHYAEIERLKRDNEGLRREIETASNWVTEKQKSWVSANEQILHDEIERKETELQLKESQITQLRKQLEKQRQQSPPQKATFSVAENIADVHSTSAAVPVAELVPMALAIPTTSITVKQQRKTLDPPPRDAFGLRDADSALAAIMEDLKVRDDSSGLDDVAFEAAMKKFEATRLRDVPKELRSRYEASLAKTKSEIDGVVIGGVH